MLRNGSRKLVIDLIECKAEFGVSIANVRVLCFATTLKFSKLPKPMQGALNLGALESVATKELF